MEIGLKTNTGEIIAVTALVVPHICEPLTRQPTRASCEQFHHLRDLKLADPADPDDLLNVDLLIGSDHYWRLVTGRVRWGRNGPMAIETKCGWILSGPMETQFTSANLTLSVTHTLKIDASPLFDDQLKRFWDLETLGISLDEASVYDNFVQQITFNGERYEVSLPWKPTHPPLPDHYELCLKRLSSLLRRLKETPKLLEAYDSIMKEQ